MPFSTLITLFKNWADDLLNSAQYLPITVTTAIALFVIKEVLDHKRKGRERLRKLNAIKLLLSQELEKNYWALISFFRVLVEIKEAKIESPNAVFRLHVARNGSEHFRIKNEPEDENEQGIWIANFHTTLYEKHIATLAEYDEVLYQKVNAAYEDIFELIHYRETLTSFLAGESDDPIDLTRWFLADMASEKKDYYNQLSNSYRTLTGKDLKDWRLR
tara:strand:- start:740 stop:1390 length:651 start_codon:yes stop_codon:yes gene_type:complete